MHKRLAVALSLPRVQKSHSMTMLLLRAPYGEEKLFALVAPAGRSWSSDQRIGGGGVLRDNRAPAFPQEAQATRNAASESAARKSFDNGVCPPVLAEDNTQTISGAQQKQKQL